MAKKTTARKRGWPASDSLTFHLVEKEKKYIMQHNWQVTWGVMVLGTGQCLLRTGKGVCCVLKPMQGQNMRRGPY